MLANFHESLQAYALRLGAFSEAPISDPEYRFIITKWTGSIGKY
jgi:hypothetical protein